MSEERFRKPGEFGDRETMIPIFRRLRNTLRGHLPCILCVFLWHAAAHAATTVQRIDVDAGGVTLQVGLSQRAAFKALQLDTREIMVAFKSADLARSAAGTHSGAGLVKQFSLEKLPDQVVSLMIDTTADIREVQAQWQGDTATLLVRLLPNAAPTAATVSVKRRKFKKETPVAIGGESHADAAGKMPEPVPEPSPEPAQEPAEAAEPSAQPVRKMVKLPEAASGNLTLASMDRQASTPPREEGLSAFITEVSRSECAKSSAVADVLALCRKREWEKAFTLLRDEIDPVATGVCQADLYYLRAFSAYEMNTAGSDRLYLDAANYFQDALSYHPNASYAPFAMLALATLYNELDSRAEAKGYYRLILKTYADHPVAADALLDLGDLYAKEHKEDQAVSSYRQYLKEYPQSSRLSEVRLALGKSLYALSEFDESLELLSLVLEEDPRRVYEDPDLLVTIGDLQYQLGNMDGARETMIKAVNLYPDSDAVPVLLARIGDTLKGDGREDQAKKVYELVMKTYPDSDGAAVSTIRYAGLLSDRAEKEAQYRMVIAHFPGHPMAKLAVIRLADLQYQAGDYGAGIETLRDLISGDLKEMQKEAEYVLASCYDGFFRRLSDRNDPLAAIAAYEKDKTLINRLQNSDMFETVGTAFYQTKFYVQAEELYQRSYKVSSPESRPASLYYHLAVTLQELGENMQAREMFLAYFRKLSENEIDPDAYLRMGRLLADEESWETALAFIQKGFQKSESDLQKAQFLILQAEVNSGMGKEAAVPDFLIKAINVMASSEASNDQLMQAYTDLGESYMKLSAYEKARDAFTMALNFSEGSRPPALLYRLAESNLESQHPEAARMVLFEVANAGDVFWARMAKEQLRSIELKEKLEMTRDN